MLFLLSGFGFLFVRLADFFWFLVCQDRVFLCNLRCPGTLSLDQTSFELIDPPPASASLSPRIKGVCYHCPANQ